MEEELAEHPPHFNSVRRTAIMKIVSTAADGLTKVLKQKDVPLTMLQEVKSMQSRLSEFASELGRVRDDAVDEETGDGEQVNSQGGLGDKGETKKRPVIVSFHRSPQDDAPVDQTADSSSSHEDLGELRLKEDAEEGQAASEAPEGQAPDEKEDVPVPEPADAGGPPPPKPELNKRKRFAPVLIVLEDGRHGRVVAGLAN